jgi:hypothetical protein
MLCDVCFRMLRGHEGRIWTGTHDLQLNHHTKMNVFRRSAMINCGICRTLFDELMPKVNVLFSPSQNEYSAEQELSIDKMELSVIASLSVQKYKNIKELYRLDFKMKCNDITGQRTFILKGTSVSSQPEGDCQIVYLFSTTQTRSILRLERRSRTVHHLKRFIN